MYLVIRDNESRRSIDFQLQLRKPKCCQQSHDQTTAKYLEALALSHLPASGSDERGT